MDSLPVDPPWIIHRLGFGIAALHNVIEWLDAHSGTAIVLLTVLLVFATISSSRSTRKALRLAKEQFDREWKPELGIHLGMVDGQTLHLVVGNLSRAAAWIETLYLLPRGFADEKAYLGTIRGVVGGGATTKFDICREVFTCLRNLQVYPQPTQKWEDSIRIKVGFKCGGEYLETDWQQYIFEIVGNSLQRVRPGNKVMLKESDSSRAG